MVGRIPALSFVVPEEGGELDDPENVVAPAGDQVEPVGELHSQRAERLPDGRDLVGDDQQQVAGRGLEPDVDRRDLVRRSGTWRSASASRARRSWTNAHTRPLAPCCLASSVSASSSERGKLARAGVDPADDAPGRDRAREHLELRVRDRLPEVPQLQSEPRVRAVDPVSRDGLGERHPRPRRRCDFETPRARTRRASPPPCIRSRRPRRRTTSPGRAA